MRKFLMILCAVMLVIGFAGSASALTITSYDDKNDQYLEKEYWTDTNGDGIFAKVEAFNTTSSTEYTNLSITIEYNEDGKSGTWESSEAINYFSIKGSTGYAIYYLEEAATAGSWNMDNVPKNNGGNTPQISHFSGWNDGNGGGNGGGDVPEPATLLLLGSGILGLAGLKRKKFNKND